MAKDFKDIDIQEILNYDHAETAVIARYERIMQHRTIEAMNGLSNRLDNVVGKLEGVMETIHRVGQLAQDKADAAIVASEKSSLNQVKQQTAMKWLTGVLVLCTVLYTIINAIVAYEMHQSNAIQRIVAETAKEQVAAALESNKIQKNLQQAAPPQKPEVSKRK